MLALTQTSAYKICINKSGDSCSSPCSNLVLENDGNKCQTGCSSGKIELWILYKFLRSEYIYIK